ncbi:MAG: metallophosphoesterase [Pseudomonadota bacterium]|nr:metallophosphoesterase [Pseudomonadota bacterium]
MTRLSEDSPLYQALAARVSPPHLGQRLGIESDNEARVFGQGTNFFHIENWYSIHSLIRGSLRLLGLHGRGRRNALQLTLQRNEVHLAELPPVFDGFTLLQISDPHLDMNADTPRTLIERVLDLDYDLCVLTGDFRARTYGPWEPAIHAMDKVLEHLRRPVYAILGNHDTIRMVPGLEESGIRVLLNESVRIEREGGSLYIAGIDDPHYYRSDNLEKASMDIPKGAGSVLLAHSPEIYRHAAHSGFRLMLCGHTHGGQICLPGGYPLTCNARCPRRLCAGPWRYHDMQGYTSRGSGVSVVDVRFNCAPEITLHTLRHTPA